MKHILATGQTRCFDAAGKSVPCEGSGQDGELQNGLGMPAADRFEVQGEVVLDRLTGLQWLKSVNSFGFPQTWREALDYVRELNARQAHGGGWRLPNRRELRSVIDHAARKPSLPPGHPFSDVVLGWHWTSTTSAVHPGYAWYVHLEGGRMFYGRKDQYCITWPVRGESQVLPATGQALCFGDGTAGHENQAASGTGFRAKAAPGNPVPEQNPASGNPASGNLASGNRAPEQTPTGGDNPAALAASECADSGEDGETRLGVVWPSPRFRVREAVVHDELTGLVWTRNADLSQGVVDWDTALETVAGLTLDGRDWRLPNINELESLVDCSRHHPALTDRHPFEGVGEAYWSSTTSGFETDWAFCLYMHKGAVGVGYKPGPEFLVWAVSG